MYHYRIIVPLCLSLGFELSSLHDIGLHEVDNLLYNPIKILEPSVSLFERKCLCEPTLMRTSAYLKTSVVYLFFNMKNLIAVYV